MRPRASRSTGADPLRFGFVVHPLTPFQRRLLGVRSTDLRMATGRPTRRDDRARLIAHLSLTDSLHTRVEGVLIGIPSLPEELLTEQESGVAALVEAVELCHTWGAEVVGLGAVAAVIGGQGKAVARAAPCAVTTGNTFTAWAAVATLAEYRRLGGRLGPVGLLGSPGAVASAILRLLAAGGEEVALISPAPAKPVRGLVERLNRAGPGRIRFAKDALPLLAQGRVLIGASSTGGRLRLSTLPRGSVVIDVAAPQDVLHDVPWRDDVLILDGEYVRLPHSLQGSSLWRRLYGLVTGQARHIFACYAEPMLLALAHQTDVRWVGRDIPLDRLEALGQLAATHGFGVEGLFERGQRLRSARLIYFE